MDEPKYTYGIINSFTDLGLTIKEIVHDTTDVPIKKWKKRLTKCKNNQKKISNKTGKQCSFY